MSEEDLSKKMNRNDESGSKNPKKFPQLNGEFLMKLGKSYQTTSGRISGFVFAEF